MENNISGKLVLWVAYEGDRDGRVYLFQAPENWSKNQACKHAEKVWDNFFVTVHQL